MTNYHEHGSVIFSRTGKNEFDEARREHVWRLRTGDRATLSEIGGRLGFTAARAYQVMCKCERLLKRRGSIHG